MPALKCSVGIQRKSGSGFKPLRRGKMPRPLSGAEPRNLADIVSRARTHGTRIANGLFVIGITDHAILYVFILYWSVPRLIPSREAA